MGIRTGMLLLSSVAINFRSGRGTSLDLHPNAHVGRYRCGERPNRELATAVIQPTNGIGK